MACDITNGRNRPCKDSLGGNSVLYLYNGLEDPFTVVDGEATAMNVLLTEAWKFELEGDLNTFSEDMPSDRNTFSRVNTQTLSIVLKKMDAETNAQFNLLNAGFPQAVIVTRNGDWTAVGIDDGIDFQIASETGGAKSDGNLYTLTGVSTTSERAPILDSATVTAFEAIVATTT